jgi:hypothetical protein
MLEATSLAYSRIYALRCVTRLFHFIIYVVSLTVNFARWRLM